MKMLISLDDYDDICINLSEEITISKIKLIQLKNSFDKINTSFISSRKDSNCSILDKAGTILNLEIYSLVYIPIIKDNFSFHNHFLIYLDLDNFKFYNDTFGYKISDNVLKPFANILKSKITSYAMDIRYDGDEFILF